MLNDSSKAASEASPDARKIPAGVTWGAVAAILVVLVSFLAAQIVSGLLISLYPHMQHWSRARTDHWLDHTISAQFAYVLLTETFTVGVLVAFLRWRHAALRALGLVRPKLRDALFAIVGVLVYFGLYAVAVGALGAVVHIDMNQQQDIGFQEVRGVLPLVMTFVSLVVLPPLVEETVFRGFLFSGLRKYGFWVALLVTSVLFALPHLLETSDGKLLWVAGIDTFVLSVVLCYLRERTGRLWAGIGVHALKNGVAFLTLFILHVR
jgi:membrane protease YdiL (CAAX protease family)